MSRLLIASLCGLAVTACTPSFFSNGKECVDGSGDSMSESREVEPFHSVEVRGAADVHLSQGPHAPLRVTAQANVLPLVVTRVADGVLIVETRECVQLTEPIVVYASAAEPRGGAIKGSGDLIGATKISGQPFEVSILGSGNARLSLAVPVLRTTINGSGSARYEGRAERHEIVVSGSGGVAAEALETATTTVSVLGSGGADVHATETLQVNVSGSGKVRYSGEPALEQSISGSGSVRRR